MDRREAAALDRHITGNYGEDQFEGMDDHCESDGSGICLVHFGRLVDTDGLSGPDVCDLSPDYEGES